MGRCDFRAISNTDNHILLYYCELGVAHDQTRPDPVGLGCMITDQNKWADPINCNSQIGIVGGRACDILETGELSIHGSKNNFIIDL